MGGPADDGERFVDPVVVALVERRLALGLSQNALAKLCGTSQSAISEIETGDTAPTLKTIRKIYEVLKLDLEVTELVASSVEREIMYLRSLSPEKLEGEILNRKWYVQPNDLIGGWCIMPVDAPPSTGCVEIAGFISKDQALHIADLHNRSIAESTWIKSGVIPDNREPSCVERWPDCWNGGYDPHCCRFPKSCSC